MIKLNNYYCLKCLKFACNHSINLKINWNSRYPKPKASVSSLKKFLRNSEKYLVSVDNLEAMELAIKLFGKEHVKLGKLSYISSITTINK